MTQEDDEVIVILLRPWQIFEVAITKYGHYLRDGLGQWLTFAKIIECIVCAMKVRILLKASLLQG